MKWPRALPVALLAACVGTEQPSAPVIEVPAPPAPVTAPPPSEPVIEAPAPAPTPPPQVEIDEMRQAADLLSYYQRVAGLGLEDQKRELATATQTLSRDKTNVSRVRVALLYAIPGTAFQDDARAAQLLEPLASGGGAVRQLAGLVYGQVTERMKTQKRADQAKDQLEQLRAMEKQLIDRTSQTPPPRKP